MTDNQSFTNMRSLMTALAKAMNLVNPEVEHHHEQTAYLAYFLARAEGMPESDAHLALYAALLHDLGSIHFDQAKTLEEIEDRAHDISRAGAKMIEGLEGFEEIAQVIAYCQYSWEKTTSACDLDGADERCLQLRRISAIVHLADVVSAVIDPDKSVLNQVGPIIEGAQGQAGKEFCPHAVSALADLGSTEFYWMDAAFHPEFLLYFTGDIESVSLERAAQLTGLMSRLIDYRSPFTAMHSAGVAASAVELARVAGMSEDELRQMEIAGYLHDVGKLAVPRTILEKPGKLTDEEFNIIKEHPYNTSLVLLDVTGFESIARWARNHHESINGRGYPFHLGGDDLDIGSRIMAVADIFSALAEVRPYREGLPRDTIENIFADNIVSGKLCHEVVELLFENYDEIDDAREKASRDSGARYFAMLEREGRS